MPFTDWDVWKVNQEKKFRGPDGRFYPPPVREMLAYNGRTDNATCARCRQFAYHQLRMVYVCEKYTGSVKIKAGWQSDWPACGLYEERVVNNEPSES
jgi:hypothetical protein